MNSKKAGILFMTQMLVMWIAVIVLGILSKYISINIVQNALLSEGILVVPAIGMLMMHETKPKVLLTLGYIRPANCFKVWIYTMLVWPTILLANLVSQLFTVNAVDAMSDSIFEMPFELVFLLVGVIGPICEEFVYRGVIYGALRRTGRVKSAIIIQALVFGLMHGNLNQFCYAFVIGIFMAYLLEASGSIISTMLMHVLINSSNIYLVFSARNSNGADAGALKTEQTAALEQLKSIMTPGVMFCVGLMLVIMAIGGLILANLLLANIAKTSHRQNWFKRMKTLPVYGKVMSWQMAAGMLLAVAMIVVELILEKSLA